MPELPDVELFHRLVRDRCRGRRIAAANIPDAGILQGISAESLARRLKGERLASSRRHGKYLFILLDGAGALAMHFGTNGALKLQSRSEEDPVYTRLLLRFDDGERLAYVNPRRIGRVSLCENPEAFVRDAGLGPDVLDAAFDLGAFTTSLGAGTRSIKSVLMDQARMAGIGNIYADEILFQAGLHPALPARRVTGESALRLFRAMHKTLETAIRCGVGAEQAVGRLPKSFLLPHRHKGGRCPRCGTLLVTVRESGRTGYYCPHCQPG